MADDVTNDDVTSGDEPQESAVAVLEREKDELASRLADAIREKQELELKVDELSPTVDVTHFLMESAADVKARFSAQHLKDMANLERIAENRERSARGDFPLPPLEAEELEAAIDRSIGILLSDREMAQPPVEGPLDRVLKMVDTKGGLRQIPYEPQINNQAGSLADGYERYRLKGFKMTKPTLCPTKDCYRPSSVDASGEFTFGAYCSADHQNRTERDTTQTSVPGVTNRNVLRGMTPG